MPIPELENVPVLVTGGAGFIGSHLVDALVERGAKVRVLDNFFTGRRENLARSLGRIDVVEGDIRDFDACRRACDGAQFVFHEAALGSVPRSMKDPATTMAVNATGTANVFAAARDAGVRRVVYASSSSVYGDSDVLPKREGQEGRPLSPYALSKVIDEQLAETFVRCFGMEIVGLRYFNVFGPRQDPSGPYAAVIPRWLAALASGKAPVIFGDGEQSRDFTYVADAARANLLAAEAPGSAGGRVYNIAGGERTTLLRLAQLLGELTGKSSKPVHEPLRQGDIPHSFADLTLASEHLGYVPTYSLATGLKKCLSGS
ncbi:MAG: SDR family oxidoreductase [Acidobacteriota bacterium]